MPEATRVLLPTLVALCLGALVGLERQIAQEERGGEKDFPGMRTFAFMALLGALAVLVSEPLGKVMAVAVFVVAGAFLVLRYRHDASLRGDPGYTTEIASLCTFAIGALAQSGSLLVATVITIAMVALLRSKRALHKAGEVLEPIDMEALIRFLIITGIILPLLPEDAIDGFYGVLRPRDVWRMVVLISGISFVGYALMRFRAGQSGYVIFGLLGGFVSSTASAVSFARTARSLGGSRPHEIMVILAASSALVRIAIVLAFVEPGLLLRVLPAFAMMSGVGMLLALVGQRAVANPMGSPALRNPLKLRLALTFASLYALVLVGVAAARDIFGNEAIYGLSVLAGLVGADAPSLSLARLVSDGWLNIETASVAVTLVAISTTFGKAVLVAIIGRRGFLLRVVPVLLAMAAAGGLMLHLSSN